MSFDTAEKINSTVNNVNVVAIIEARMNTTRLSRKIMLP